MNDDRRNDERNNDEPDRVLCECDRSRRDRPGAGDALRLLIRSYRGRRYCDLRVWYRDERGELRPGKGTSIRLHEIGDVIRALELAREELADSAPPRRDDATDMPSYRTRPTRAPDVYRPGEPRGRVMPEAPSR